MSKLVTVYGGSGFVGRYIVQALAANGWRVRVAVRRPNEAMYVKPYGVPGQVEPVLCNIRDDASVAAVMRGADAVVNCVGVPIQTGKNTFDAVHNKGAERVARLAKEEGISHLVHLSAIGADIDAESEFSKSKAEGEAAILQHMPDAVILRPSAVFGNEDSFFNRLGFMSRLGPIFPSIGANTLFQPVYVEDVAKTAVMAVEGNAAPGIYELGGPEAATLRDWTSRVLQIVQRRRLVVSVPFWIARIKAFGFDMMQVLSFGLITNAIVTRDQVKALRRDNIVSDDAKSLADLGIKPVAAGSLLESYMWRYRTSGQYNAIRDSAKNLRT